MIDYFSNVKFYKSFADIKSIINDKLLFIPVVAVTGRSNSGKSSLINALCNQKHLALTSSMPGKTKTINYYYVPAHKPHHKEFYLVDLPGFGFAKLSRKQNQDLENMIDDFLANAPSLKLILLIMDARRSLEKEEISILNYCKDHNKKIFLVRSKWDKLNQSEKNQCINQWKEENLYDISIPISSTKRINIDKVIQNIINNLYL